MQENLIHSLTVDLSFENNEGSINDIAENLYNQHIFPSINDTINQMDDNDIVVDRIFIDLGDIEEENIYSKLSEELKAQITKNKIENITDHTFKEYHNSDSLNTYNLSSMSSQDIIRFVNDIKMSDKDDRIQYECVQLLEYLYNETVPWQYISSDSLNITSFFYDTLQEIVSDSVLLTAFFNAIYGNVIMIWRLLQIADSATLVNISKQLISHRLAAIPSGFEEYEILIRQYILPNNETILDEKGSDSVISRRTRTNTGTRTQADYNNTAESSSHSQRFAIDSINELRVITSLLLGVKYDSIDVPNAQILQAEESYKENEYQMNSEKEDEIDSMTGGTKTSFSNNTIKKEKEETDCNRSNHNRSNKHSDQNCCGDSDYNDNREVLQRSISLLNTLKKQSENIVLSEELSEPSLTNNSRIHIDDAGLILIHPFLPSFFSRLNLLTEDNHFISIDAQKRAVHLLKHLTGIHEKLFSSSFVLEKVLCGLPVTFPIANDFTMTEEEEREADDLLKTVCEYWKPLNKSSIQGLQNTFIRRAGTIEYSDEIWIVRVEGNAFDILLEDLSWEISTIILPWLEPMICVEWQAE